MGMIYNPGTNLQLTAGPRPLPPIACTARDGGTMPRATLRHKQSQSNKTLCRFVPLFCFPAFLVSRGLWSLTG